MSCEPTRNVDQRSTGAPLCNLDYMGRYQAHLTESLPPDLNELTRFFAAPARLKTLAAILTQHFAGSGGRVLNAGCGPFATELFVSALQGREIESFDYTSGFAPLHAIFQKDGKIGNTRFQVADALTVEYPDNSFDLVIIHDVFYETGLPMDVLLRKFHRSLRPGGLLFFDFVNRRTEWLWRMLGSSHTFNRYDPDWVRQITSDLGYSIIEWQPTYGNSSLAKLAIHKLSEIFLRQSNGYAVLIRKQEG
jgi:SAM-dependent methyltransferase